MWLFILPSLFILPALFTNYRYKWLNIAIVFTCTVVVALFLQIGAEDVIWAINRQDHLHAVYGAHYFDRNFLFYLFFAAVPVLLFISSVIVARYTSPRGCVIWGAVATAIIALGAIYFYSWVEPGVNAGPFWLTERFGAISYTFMLVQSITVIPTAYLLHKGTRRVLRIFAFLLVLQGLLYAISMPIWFYSQMGPMAFSFYDDTTSLREPSLTSLLLIFMMALCTFIILHAIAYLHPKTYSRILNANKEARYTSYRN